MMGGIASSLVTLACSWIWCIASLLLYSRLINTAFYLWDIAIGWSRLTLGEYI